MTSVSGIEAENLTAPIPVVTGRPRWRDTAIALRSYNYRMYVIGQLFANTGGWMARIAIDWLGLELTGNVALVGIVVALQFAPTIVLGAWAGVLSDRAESVIAALTPMKVDSREDEGDWCHLGFVW